MFRIIFQGCCQINDQALFLSQNELTTDVSIFWCFVNVTQILDIKKLADLFYMCACSCISAFVIFEALLKPFVLFILQEQKLNKLVIDPTDAKEFERPFNSHARLNDHAEKGSLNNQVSDSHSLKLDSGPNHFESASSSGEDQSV